MSMPALTSNDLVRQQQVREQTIAALAKESHVELDQVRELYDATHASLSAQARIKTFVGVIATRIVRSALQETEHAVQ